MEKLFAKYEKCLHGLLFLLAVYLTMFAPLLTLRESVSREEDAVSKKVDSKDSDTNAPNVGTSSNNVPAAPHEARTNLTATGREMALRNWETLLHYVLTHALPVGVVIALLKLYSTSFWKLFVSVRWSALGEWHGSWRR